MTKTFLVEVKQTVRVTLDETKFDTAFMSEFPQNGRHLRTLEDHAENIGQLYACGLIDLGHNRYDMIEGYGHAHLMGIEAEQRLIESHVVDGGES